MYGNSFIEASHVLHETLATNNCFSAEACWHFLISRTYHPIEITSAHTRVSGRFAKTAKDRRREDGIGGVNGHLRSIIDTLLYIYISESFFNNPSNSNNDTINIFATISAP